MAIKVCAYCRVSTKDKEQLSSFENQMRYHRLKKQASKVVVLAAGYSSGVYYRRNRHLVDNSSVCVAYMNRANSGTSYTVNYAKAKRLEVVNTALF